MFVSNQYVSRSMRVAEEFSRSHFPLNLWSLVQTHVGSIAHGTYIPSDDPHHIDDVDIMGVFVQPPKYVAGLSALEHTVWQNAELDVVLYGVQKYARLALKGNPNVLMLLWQPQELDLQRHGIWETWRQERDAFLSRRVAASFSGYAHGQLRRLGKPNTRGYMGREREALFAKYGYDVKNAAHLVRLLRMGCELVETGTLNIDRTHIDADELKDIKRGQWSLNHIEREAEAGFRRLERALRTTSLSDTPNFDLVESLVLDTFAAFWLADLSVGS